MSDQFEDFIAWLREAKRKTEDAGGRVKCAAPPRTTSAGDVVGPWQSIRAGDVVVRVEPDRDGNGHEVGQLFTVRSHIRVSGGDFVIELENDCGFYCPRSFRPVDVKSLFKSRFSSKCERCLSGSSLHYLGGIALCDACAEGSEEDA